MHHKRQRLGSLVAVVFSLLAATIGYRLADSYIDRLSDHRGFYLVPVDNEVRARPAVLPRRTVFVLVDGLRQDAALDMASTQRLAKQGACRPTNMGPVTVSRPVYSVLSTGLEQERTGSRNNDDTSPLASESIWEVAHRAGLQVQVASNLEWWPQLFPGAFDQVEFNLDESVNLFEPSTLGELSLIHPVRVDTAGHSDGAASKAYAAAVALVDAELGALLDGLDLRRDLVVLTADHGHTDSGGHGAPSPEVAQVLTCLAGPGIAAREGGEEIDARIIAPTLSVLLGLPFPKHMRAGEDGLDQIWSLVDEAGLGAAYAEERKASILRFRSVNTEQLGQWLGTEEGRWSALYDRGIRRHQLWWFALAVVLMALFAAGARVRGQGWRAALTSLLWMVSVLALSGLVYSWIRGSFDFNSINKRQEFLRVSLGTCLSLGLAGALVHLAVWRDPPRLQWDYLTLLGGLLAVAMAHPLIYGVPLHFPLPGRIMIFLPFFLGAQVIASAMLTVAIATGCAWRPRTSAPTPLK